MGQVSTVSAKQYTSNEEYKKALLLDVRTPAEYRSEHIAEATLLPVQSLEPGQVQAVIRDEQQVVCILCQSGKRAEMAVERLRGGLNNPLVIIEGGLNALKTCGVEVNIGKGVISLERQVRIAAGSLVLFGVVLGFMFNPSAFYLSGFVGVGLVFAGVTDTCGMGMLLAKMPWNN